MRVRGVQLAGVLALVAVGSGCAFVAQVNVDSLGSPVSAVQVVCSISHDGRYVAFVSQSDDLVPDDTNNDEDLFVRDLRSGTTVRASVDSAGAQFDHNTRRECSLSGDGRYVAFAARGVLVRDLHATTSARVDSAGGLFGGVRPLISADGRYVAFASQSGDLVVGDTNGASDVFVHDRLTGSTSRVSNDNAGTPADMSLCSISDDGRYIVFRDNGAATQVLVHDRQTGTTRLLVTSDITSRPMVSGDGRYVVFHSSATDVVAGDTNGVTDVFVLDRHTGATERVSIDSGGTQGNGASVLPSVSGDGRYVAFTSDASNLVAGDTNGLTDGFVHDRQTGTTSRVTGERGGWASPISGNGRYVALRSLEDADDEGHETDLFVRYTVIPTVTGVSPDSAPRGTSTKVTITGTGFQQDATISMGAGITVTSVKVLDETRIRADITIAPAAVPAAHNVQVTNVGSFGPASGATNLCFGCLAVT